MQRTIEAALSPGTVRNYNTFVKRFGEFLDLTERSLDVVNTVIILEFLSQFTNKDEFTYSYVRGLKSAIVQMVQMHRPEFKVDEALISKFMAGAFNLCRPLRRKRFSWDPDLVLNFISNQPFSPNIAQSAKETLIILALATGLRADDLHKLGAHIRHDGRDRTLFFKELQKTSRKRKTLRDSITLQAFVGPQRLCPVFLIDRYLHLTNIFEDRSEFLFVRSDTGKRVELNTLRSWLVDILQQAGIQDTPGSTRAASTSKAWFTGKTFDSIAAMTGWTTPSTFQQFYKRELRAPGINLMNPN